MALQLPERGAPPSNNNWAQDTTTSSSSPITSTSSSSNSRQRRKSSSSSGAATMNKTRTARPPTSPFIVSGKAAPSPLLPSKARSFPGQYHQHHHAGAGATAAAGHAPGGTLILRLEEIKHMNDVRRLEDMLSHNESLLSNTTLCAQLPGGYEHVQARNEAMKNRLDHLYNMHAINVQLEDTKVATGDDENPFMEEEEALDERVGEEQQDKKPSTSVKMELADELPQVKSEDDSHTPKAASPQLNSGSASQLRSYNNSSPPLSSSPTNGSPGAFHRHWKQNIANRTTMVGRIGQLSMDESLSLLQSRANHRMRVEQEAERLAAEAGRRRPTRKGPAGSLSETGDLQIVSSNEPQELGLPEEEEDFDWSTEGYYHNDEEAS